MIGELACGNIRNRSRILDMLGDLPASTVADDQEVLETEEQVIISVRGVDKYVVMGLEKYARICEAELDMAIREARADYEAGRTTTESVDDHMKRLANEL